MTRNSINVPIQIPVWSLVCMLAGALFTAGTLYNQMNMLIESNKRGDARMTLISEKQIGDGATISNLQLQAQNHEARLTNAERALLDVAKGARK